VPITELCGRDRGVVDVEGKKNQSRGGRGRGVASAEGTIKDSHKTAWAGRSLGESKHSCLLSPVPKPDLPPTSQDELF
jgi:hypothetical protein